MIKSFIEKLTNLDIRKTQKIAIATSGGSDSTALCFLCKQAGLNNSTAIIVDHKYRKNSTQEAKQVKEYLVRKLGFKKNNVVILTNKKPIPKTGIEEFLRKVRYELIFDFCKKNKINKVLMAHHLDDQIETFLMRLERGAGLDGLTGMKEITTYKLQTTNYRLNIIRPLLSYTKEELTDILIKNKIKWWKDESNKNIKLTRNNIRASLEGFSDYPLIRKRLSGVIENIDRAKDFIEQEKIKSAKKVIKKSKNKIDIDLNEYQKLHEEIRLRILRDLVKQNSKTGKDVRMDSIKILDFQLINKDFKRTSLQGIEFKKSDNYKLIIG